MGRKKQTIISTGGIIGDSLDKNVAFMMGRVHQLSYREDSLAGGRAPTHTLPNHFGKVPTGPLKPNTKIGKLKFPSNDHLNKGNFVFRVEEPAVDDKQSPQISFNYGDSFSELDIEGLDSDIELESSIRNDDLADDLEMTENSFELDIEGGREPLSGSESEVAHEMEPSPSENLFKKDDKLNVKNLELKGFNPMKPIIPKLARIGSLAPISYKSDSEGFCGDDEPLLQALVSKFDDLEMFGDDIDDPHMDLDLKGLDSKYSFGEKKGTVKNFLQKRVKPENYSVSLLMQNGPKKVKNRLLLSGPNLIDTQDGFYNLLIDRYRPQYSPT